MFKLTSIGIKQEQISVKTAHNQFLLNTKQQIEMGKVKRLRGLLAKRLAHIDAERVSAGNGS